MTIIREDGKRIDLAMALEILRPGSKWVIEENDYSKITWDENNNQELPTETELLQEVNRLETEYFSLRYQIERKQEYPAIAEQLDMIYHDIDSWKETINNIKAKYPKPE